MVADSGQGKVVVGIDGSRAAARALAWALAEARLRGCPLRVVYVFPALVSYAGTAAHEYYPQVETDAADVIERAIAALGEHPGALVERALVPGNPADELVEASRGATLLVVGSRGLGGFRGMLTGSVSIHCVHHAHCPVVVVRSDS